MSKAFSYDPVTAIQEQQKDQKVRPIVKDFWIRWFQNSATKRFEDSQKVLKQYPDRVPIIIGPGSKNAPDIATHKFLVPKQLSVGQFLYTIRSRIKLMPDQALFLFVVTFDSRGNMLNSIIASSSKTIAQIHHEYADTNDGFVYMKYDLESTFG